MQLRSKRRLGTWNVLRLETLTDRDPQVGVTEGNAGNTQVRQPSPERISFAEIALLYTGYRAWSRPYTGYCGFARFSRFSYKKVRTGPSARLPSSFVRSAPSYFVSDLGAIVVHRHRHWLNKAPCLAPVADMPEKATPGSQRCGEPHSPIHSQLVLQQSLRRAIWLSSFHDGHSLTTHFVP